MAFLSGVVMQGALPAPMDLEIYKSCKVETLHTYSTIFSEKFDAKRHCPIDYVTVL